MKIIGIHDGRWSPPPASETGLPARFGRARWYKANPRDRDYMQALFAERFADGRFVDVAETQDWPARIADADEIVLLYPDATGLGFGATEHSILRQRHPIQDVTVLNGRRRYFQLDATTRRQLRWRRFLERWMLGEALCMPFVLIAALLLAAYDHIQKTTGGARD